MGGGGIYEAIRPVCRRRRPKTHQTYRPGNHSHQLTQYWELRLGQGSTAVDWQTGPRRSLGLLRLGHDRLGDSSNALSLSLKQTVIPACCYP